MAYDQGLPGVAQRYYILGLNACQEAGSAILAAKILGDMTQLSTAYQHYEDSLDLIRTALYIVLRHRSALVRAELLGLDSRAHAHLGNAAAATRAAEACIDAWQEIRLAKVRLAQHDLVESVNVAQTALELAAPTSSGVVGDWLLRFHGELTARYPRNAHIAPFSEHLREYVKRTAPHKEHCLATT